MSLHTITIFAAVAVASIGVALACGPFFPWQLLDDRAATLEEAPAGLNFISQLKNLVALPRGELKVVESNENDEERRLEPHKVEEEEGASEVWRALTDRPLPPNVYFIRLGKARQADTAEAALAAGAGLPPAVLEYVAGAVAFNAGEFEQALPHFQAIDRLPAAQRHLREVAAAFMQARTYRQLGDFAAARTAFQAARARALAGAPDPMGLGLASLGEEARLDLIASGLVEIDGFTPSDGDRAKAGVLIARAVGLYAEQAARGSKTARGSLRDVASLLVANDELLAQAIAEPIVRRLLVAYCIANDRQSEWEDAAATPRDGVAAKLIDALLAQTRPAAGDDVDRLAMMSYQTGRYEAAEKLTAATDRSLGLWVRAKLALRRDDRAAAIRDLAAALKAVTADLDEPARNRLRGELAVAQLSVGKYRDSMEMLFPLATVYWGNVAYVAERVLTIDELKTFVDGLKIDGKPVDPDAQETWWFQQSPTIRLRELLARRLMRDGRLDAAIPYFPKATADVPQQKMAEDYRAAVAAARPTSWWRNVSRAEALFRVATLTRTQGMETMGTEGPPDLAVMGGSFYDGIGQTGPWGRQRRYYDDRWAEYDRTVRMVDGWESFVDPSEMVRVAASSPHPETRFHYRAVAADRAMEAAALLPHGSQAYAATLCWASRYAKEGGDPQRAWSIYQHYVATGPYQPWAKAFGSTCPDPDFDAARDYWPKRILRLTRQHTALAVGVGLAVVLLVAGSIVAIRRRRAA